jgi:hypothetical protein
VTVLRVRRARDLRLCRAPEGSRRVIARLGSHGTNLLPAEQAIVDQFDPGRILPFNRYEDGADVHTESGEQDPLKQLERWGRRAGRRARRAWAARRLARALTAPVRALFRPQRAGVIVVIVVVVVAALWFSRSLLSLSGSGAGRAYPTVSRPSGVFATSSATADPAGPFARTPAARWAEGEAGITLPPGAAVTDFAAEEVAAHLATVKAALVAGRLDHKMLVDHDPRVPGPAGAGRSHRDR